MQFIPSKNATIIIVDDDLDIRASLDSLFRSWDFCVETYSEPSEFLDTGLPSGDCCLILDIHLKNIDGLEFQASLEQSGINIPVIIITGHGDIPMAVRGMKAGAIDFLTKPFTDDALLKAINTALKASHDRRQIAQERIDIECRYEQLSAREREVMALVASGLMNKQIAARLELSLITIKIHRANAMKKMQAESLAEFVRIAEFLGIRDETITRYHQNG